MAQWIINCNLDNNASNIEFNQIEPISRLSVNDIYNTISSPLQLMEEVKNKF